MDSGVGAENVHTLEEALEAKLLPPAQTLTIQQLIGIIDQLFILLVLITSYLKKKRFHSLFLFSNNSFS